MSWLGRLFLLILGVTSCSITLPSEGPSPADYSVVVDATRDDYTTESTLYITSRSEQVPVQLKTKVRSDHLDGIRVSLKDSFGANRAISLEHFPEDDDWIFFALKDEETWSTAQVAAELWRKVGRWSPRTAKVKLSLNGSFAQWWMLSETIGRNEDRVSLKKLLPDEVSMYGIQGGYLYEVGRPTPNSSSFDFLTVDGLVGSYKYPKVPSLAQRFFLESLHNELELILADSALVDPTQRPEDVADLSAMADWIIVGELVGLVPFTDFEPVFSKDRDGRITPVAAPDYRKAFQPTDGRLVLRSIPLVDHLMTYRPFQKLLWHRWVELRDGDLGVSSLLTSLEDRVPNEFLLPVIRALIDRSGVVDTRFREVIHG